MKSFSISVRIFRRIFFLSVWVVLGASASASEALVQSRSTSVLVDEVQDLLAAGSYKTAAAYLREILVRLDSLTDAESLAARASCLYQLGECLLRSGDYLDAASSFKTFIADFPGDELVPLARFMVLEAYARQNDRVQMDAWLTELRGSGAFDGLIRFFSDPKNADFRRNTVLTLMTGYAEQGDLDNLRAFLPFFDEPGLADARFNLALMEGGDRAFEASEYPRALALYRMVRLKDELLPVYKKQIAELQEELKKPLPWVPIKEQERQQELRQAEQDRLEGLKQTLQFFSDSGYDLDLMLRTAQCYNAMQRFRISLAVYQHLYTRFPEHRLAEQSRVSAFQSLLALNEQDEAIAAGLEYLELYPLGRFEDDIIVNLMQLYLTRDELAAAGDAGQRALDALPNRRLADQITWMLGFVRLQQQEWSSARDLFSGLMTKWPQSIYVQDADYWNGMCFLFEGQFGAAASVFKAYLENTAYQPARFAADSTYRLGVAQYGMGEFDEAEGTFKQFLVFYPDDPLVSEAYSMLGDLRGADGELDLALTLYQQAVGKAVDAEQDSYAVFQSARVYELQLRYVETVDLMNAYIARRGDKARLAEAALWIGKSFNAQGDHRQALEIYLKTLLDYGNNPRLDGMDQVTEQLLADLQDEKYSRDSEEITARLDAEQIQARQNGLRPLALRLAAVLARLSGESGRGRYIDDLLSEQDPEVFSPLPMIVLAEHFLNSGEPDEVKRLAEEFKNLFPASEQIVDLLIVESSALLAAKQYEQAVAVTQEILDRYEENPRSATARKLQADAFRLSGDWARAIEMYQKLFSNRTWQGSLAPETLYWIGVCRLEQGDPEKAFAFFQRIYVLYKGHPEWVAKAYEASVDCLERMGRKEEAVLTWREMIGNASIQGTPEVQRAREALRRHDGL